MRVLLVNASHPVYNLGLQKAERWWQGAGAHVERDSDVRPLLPQPEMVWISAIFSWDVPRLMSAARTALDLGKGVEVGGPGTFGLRERIHSELGLWPQASPDPRFERQSGSYRMVFWSRGCPAKNCALGFPRNGDAPICSVPQMEGWRFTLHKDATPAPVILDNNLSALPRDHQELIVARTLEEGFDSVDANSGFEPRSLQSWTVELWRQLPLVAWRFAYDELAERQAVLRAMAILDEAGISRRARRIYCLAGNEPIDECERRVNEIRSWDCYPIVQRRRPLDWMGGPLPVLHDWTEQRLIDFQRWGNRLARGLSFAEYRRGQKNRYAAGKML